VLGEALISACPEERLDVRDEGKWEYKTAFHQSDKADSFPWSTAKHFLCWEKP
jgi:hypothetical protein